MKGFIPIQEIHYPKCKTTRPHVRLHDGTILKYCYPNAGIWKGYDSDFNRRKVHSHEIKEVKYNDWHEWLKWQKDNWDKLYK